MDRGMKTKDLLKSLCENLGHADCVGFLAKKLCNEHWLDKADDLRYVPRARLEGWGVPLKLVAEIYQTLEEQEVSWNVNGISAYINYTVRPAVSSTAPFAYFSKLKDDELREKNPEEWAARRLQGRWRTRKMFKARQADALASVLSSKDFGRKSEEQMHEVRRKRAEDKLRRLVRLWRARRAFNKGREVLKKAKALDKEAADVLAMVGASGEDGVASSLVGGSVELHIVQAWLDKGGKLKDCEVSRLLRQIGNELEREPDDITPHIHRLVTINWLEDVEDLELVEDRHWTQWDMPEQLVVRIKSVLLEKTEGSIYASVGGFFGSMFGSWS